MPRPAVVLALLAGVVATSGGLRPRLAEAADPPGPAAVARLVGQLGDPEFARRERATRDLDAVGPAALGLLRQAARSADPEVARRAADLAGRIDRRAANEKALAPTAVALKAAGAPLAAVLADLSKQAGFPVFLGGPTAAEVADDPVTLDTGRVPFWEAVRAVTAAADLQIASASGFAAPGGAAPPAARVADPAGAVCLEPRGLAPRRPAAVFGAVLVEAVPVPAAPPGDAAVTLLLVWPEPKLNWQAAGGVRVDRAADAGRELAGFPDVTPATTSADRVTAMRQLGGRRVVFDDISPAPAGSPVPGFTPNARQAVVRLRPGDAPPSRADLAGAIAGTVRAGPEALVRLDGLKPGAAAEGSHPAGVDLRAVVVRKDGRWELTADLLFDPTDVAAAGAGGDAPAVPGAGFRDVRGAARTVLAGLRVADADGGEYEPVAIQSARPFRADPGRISVRVVAVLHPKEGRPPTGDPSAVSFWGTYNRAVEVPFALAGVPLTGGFGG
jgi:hypothetical protein